MLEVFTDNLGSCCLSIRKLTWRVSQNVSFQCYSPYTHLHLHTCPVYIYVQCSSSQWNFKVSNCFKISDKLNYHINYSVSTVNSFTAKLRVIPIMVAVTFLGRQVLNGEMVREWLIDNDLERNSRGWIYVHNLETRRRNEKNHEI